MKRLWRNPDFVKLWSAQTTSAFGSQIAMLAYPLTALLLLNATTFQMGVLRAAGSAASFGVGIFAGVIVDRMSRKMLLILADLGRGFLAFLIPVSAYFGFLRLELMYAITFVSGALNIIADVAGMSFMPSLVKKGELVEANSKMAVSDSATIIAGPGMSGVLIQVLTAPITILIDAISFVFSAVIIATIPRPYVREIAARKPVLTEVLEGIRFVYDHPLLRPMAQAVALSFLFMPAISTIFTVYAVRELNMDAFVLGLVFSALGVGLLIGALAAPALSERFGKGNMMVAGSFLQFIAAAMIPASSGSTFVPTLIFAHILLAFGIQLNGVNLMSMRQGLTPDNMQGRMNGSFRFVNLGMAMVGAVAAGWLGEMIGLRTTLAILAAGLMLQFLRLFFSPIRGFNAEPSAA